MLCLSMVSYEVKLCDGGFDLHCTRRYGGKNYNAVTVSHFNTLASSGELKIWVSVGLEGSYLYQNSLPNWIYF